MSLNKNEKIEIVIDNTQAVELDDLVSSMKSFSSSYSVFINNDIGDVNEVDTKLYVDEVRKGSIVISLIANTIPIVPLLVTANTTTLTQWFEYFTSLIRYIDGKQDKKRNYSNKEIIIAKDSLAPVIKDNNGSITINHHHGDKVVNNFSCSHADGVRIANGADKLIDSELSENVESKHKIPIKWVQTNFDAKHTGNRVKLISITGTPVLKAIFDNDAIKDGIIHTEYDGRQWQDLIYFVDAEITYINNVAKIFKIIRYYPEDTDYFDDE